MASSEWALETPILIWGAGAIGGTMGAYLARAGHEVHFVDSLTEHVERIAVGDLTIETENENFTVGGPAFTPDHLKGKYDLVLLAVRSYDTIAASEQIKPHLTERGAIISAQNGLNEDIIASIVDPDHTIGCFVNFGADWQDPGRIHYGGRGVLVLGELDNQISERVKTTVRILQDFEPNAVATDNIFGYLWSKTAYAAVLASSAVCNQGINEFWSDPEALPFIIDIVAEVLDVGLAEGNHPMPFQGFEPEPFLDRDLAAIRRAISALIDGRKHSKKTHSGIWRDLMVRKRRTEVTAQLTPVIECARRHGLETPKIDALLSCICHIENDRLAASPINLGALVSA